MVLKDSDRSLVPFAYGAITLYGGPFQCPSASSQICNSLGLCSGPSRALQPPLRNGCSLITSTGLGFSPFARHYSGNDFFSSGY